MFWAVIVEGLNSYIQASYVKSLTFLISFLKKMGYNNTSKGNLFYNLTEVNKMLVSAKEMLDKAKAGHYAVGQFNINNLEWTKSILLTAQEKIGRAHV